MRSILKMDLYRLKKDKLPYIIGGLVLATTILLCLVVILLRLLFQQFADLGVEAAQVILDEYGYYLPSTYTGLMEMTLRGSDTSLMIMLFSVIFYGAEYNKGYIKNTAAKTRGIKGVLSKLVIMLLASTTIYLIVALTTTFVSLVAGMFNPAELVGLIKVFFTGILLNLAMSSLVTMLFCFWQKLVPTLISGICYILLGGYLSILLGLISSLVKDDGSFDINKFLCIGNLLTYLSASEPALGYVRMVGIALAMLGVTTVVSAYLTKKKDIS